MAEATHNRTWVRTVCWVLLIGALALAFAPNFAEMWNRWFPAWDRTDLGLYDRLMEGESYYTHAPLMPLLSLLIAFLLIRHTRIRVQPDRFWGGLVLGGSLLAHLLASLARVNFASGVAFVGVVAGLILLLWGRNALRRLWFPVALLLFMVPAPEVSIAQLNFRLKMFAADWGVRGANLLTIIAERSGNRVFLEGDKSLVVANVCNGLRTLISLLVFGAIYTYVCRLNGLWRIIIFLLSVPVAVIANAVRITSLIVVADLVSVEVATGWYHDSSGILIFVVAFFLMFGIEKFILWFRQLIGKPAHVTPLFSEVRREDDQPAPWPAMRDQLVRGAKGPLAIAAIALVGVGALMLNRQGPAGVQGDALAETIPAVLTVAGTPRRSYTIELDPGTLTTLESPAYLYRRYVAAGKPPVDLCLIFSRNNRKATHPPDLCLEGSGEGIVAKRDFELAHPADSTRRIPCREIVVQDGGGNRSYFLYTYRIGQSYTRSFWVQQWSIFINGVLRRQGSGALVRVNTTMTDGRAAARRRATAMMTTAVQHLDRIR